MSAEPSPQVDTIVQAVLDKFIAHSVLGKKKYDTNLDATARRAVPTSAISLRMDREDLTSLEWIQHAQEEHMDAILYLEKLKRVLSAPVPLSSHSTNPS